MGRDAASSAAVHGNRDRKQFSSACACVCVFVPDIVFSSRHVVLHTCPHMSPMRSPTSSDWNRICATVSLIPSPLLYLVISLSLSGKHSLLLFLGRRCPVSISLPANRRDKRCKGSQHGICSNSRKSQLVMYTVFVVVIYVCVCTNRRNNPNVCVQISSLSTIAATTSPAPKGHTG